MYYTRMCILAVVGVFLYACATIVSFDPIPMSEDQFETHVQEFLDRHQVPHPEKIIFIEANENFKRTSPLTPRDAIAVANCRMFINTCIIQVKLCALDSYHARQVAYHEAAHMVNFYKNNPYVKPHGPEWKSIMKTSGFNPTPKLYIKECDKKEWK